MSITALAMPLIMTASLDVSRVSALDIEQSEVAPPVIGGTGPDEPVMIIVPPIPVVDDTGTEETAPPESEELDSEDAGKNEIVVSARMRSEADPVEQLNLVSYEAVQALDSALIGPIAHAYEAGVPEPVRDGIHNVLSNLDEPIVFLNFLLQFKFGKAAETLGRFAINSTLGMGGLFDVAEKKPFNLPRRSNGLADTLGFYGVGPGPYLFLPLIGSTTVRDLVARPFDLLILPTAAKPFADPKVALAKSTGSALDERQQNDEKLKAIHSATDPYVAQREEYLARRQAEIDVLKGKRKSIYDPLYYELPGFDPQGEGEQAERQDPAPTPQDTQAGEETPSPALVGEGQP